MGAKQLHWLQTQFYGLAVSSRSSIVYMINITDFINFWKRISSAIGALICAIAMNFVQCDTGASLATSNMGADEIKKEISCEKSKIFLIKGKQVDTIRKYFL